MVQGEDGISFDALSSTLDGSTGVDKNAWSYKSALALLSSNDNAGMGAEVERTSVASIIAAARSNLRRGKGDEEENDKAKAEDGSDSSTSDSNNEDEDDASDDDSSSGSSSSDDEVDDADKAAHSMESDVLKVQERPQRKKKGKEASSATVVESTNEEDNESSSGDDDDEEEDEDVEGDADCEEERKEASKAAAFFDSSHIATTQDSTIDSFSQLGLSRPLLRGVASMGFVSPTPIQASVIPVALAGRDVCASAVTGSEFRLLILLLTCNYDLIPQPFCTKLSVLFIVQFSGGKTAAFLLPIMERILQRGGGRATLGGPNATRKQNSLAATRALVLAPTRELAAQCVSMMMAMAKYTELRAALIVGGAKNVMSQVRHDIISCMLGVGSGTCTVNILP